MFATINGTKLAFDDVGNGPTVILLHDLPLCRKMWEPQVKDLADHGYRVVAPDLRGFGESEADYRPFSIKLCCNDIAALMRYLGIGRAVFVGMGSAHQLINAMQQFYPGRVAAACIISPREEPADALTRVRFSDLAALVREGKRLTAIDCLCKHLLPQGQNGPEIQQLAWQIQRWMEMADPTTMTSALNLIIENHGSHNPMVPTLLVNSSPHKGNSVSQADRSSPTMVERIAGTWPLVNLELPYKFNECLMGFLDWFSLAKPGHHRLAIAA